MGLRDLHKIIESSIYSKRCYCLGYRQNKKPRLSLKSNGVLGDCRPFLILNFPILRLGADQVEKCLVSKVTKVALYRSQFHLNLYGPMISETIAMNAPKKATDNRMKQEVSNQISPSVQRSRIVLTKERT